jgi:hypothetical protein
MRQLALIVSLGLVAAAPASAAVGHVRLLVLPLTSGLTVPSTETMQAQIAQADGLVRRSSFGRASLVADVAPAVTGFAIPQACFAGANEDAGLGALSLAARAQAVRLGYDLSAYDRFVYVFPDAVCGHGGLGSGRDVLLGNPEGLGAIGLLHELGHTFRLPHAGSSTCPTCGIREYGDRTSFMGQGSIDFSAWEKAQLGWIDTVRRTRATGSHRLDPVDVRSGGPQALLVRVAAGTLWIEKRLLPAPRVEIRIVRRGPGGGATRPVLLASGRTVATVGRIVTARATQAGVSLTRPR